MEGRKFLHLIILHFLYLCINCDFQQVTGQHFYTTQDYYQPRTEDYYRPATRDYYRQSTRDYYRPTTRDYYRQSTRNYYRLTTRDYYRQSTLNYYRPGTRDYYRRATRDYYRPTTRDYYRPATRDYYRLSSYNFFNSASDYFQEDCQVENQASGEIDFASQDPRSKCWRIVVLPNSYVRLNVTELLLGRDCRRAYAKIQVAGTGQEFRLCGDYSREQQPIIAFNDVKITLYNSEYTIKSKIHYDIETGVTAVDGVDISRENSIRWLRRQWSTSFGWGRNTHRAITALYLTGAAGFGTDNMEIELMAKQLELQTSVALLRNATDPLSVSDLSMFINALTATCHNPRQFYGHDLLQILGERVVALKNPSPAAYLTLCNGNWTFTESNIRSLLKVLHTHSEYPFHLDIQAMTVMVLSCVRNKTKLFEGIKTASELYNSTIQSFIYGQLLDGSFGSVYTTALVTQALLSSGQEINKLWKIESTMKYLMKELNTSANFFSVYLTLPVFKGKTLLDIANANCANFRKHGEDDDITGITKKLGGKVRIQYSLYLGDQKHVIHTMYLKTSGNNSAYEVMKLAQVVDHKYKFQHTDLSGNVYVHTIAGITNDPEVGKFWFLYTGDSHINGTVHHHTKSPNKLMLADGDHLIMWYKTADI